MNDTENLESFYEETRSLVREYVETRIRVFRLEAIRILVKSAGFMLWVSITLLFIFLVLIFSGITLGIWLSELTHSYPLGFGIMTLFFILLFIILAVFRKPLFINPFISILLRRAGEKLDETLTIEEGP